MPVKRSKAGDSIYQLKITLCDSHPPIWRRVLVPGHYSLYELHQVIQIAIGWYDLHLHQFMIEGKCYGISDDDDFEPMADERRFILNKVLPSEKGEFVYEYDFGDGWEHEIMVEKKSPPDSGIKYPVCIEGQRACPPEDVGGIGGYETFLEAIQDPKHEEHASCLEWVGGEFDAEAFDLEQINRELRGIK